MKTKEYPSQEYLKECFSYDNENGALNWKLRPMHHFSCGRVMNIWNAKYSSKPAGYKKQDNGKFYSRVTLDRSSYYTHRLVWILFNGHIDDGKEVDHINGNGLDNRIDNLRLVDRLDNMKNVRKASSNSSGQTGVCWCNRESLWRARIGFNGKRIHIGRFNNLEDAIKARKEAEKKYGYHKNHGSNRPL